MSLKDLGDISYFRLNNEINRPVNGKIPLHKDKEALKAFFAENVLPNTMSFTSITEKIEYLISNDYIESAFIQKYRPEFITELDSIIKSENFRFKSFMAAYKFYQQYALKTNDGEHYLENLEDRVLFNALYFADGQEGLAKDLAVEMINQRYQPATPSFLNAGRSRRGELVSCFLIQVTDDMNSIGRSINSALQLSRIGGGVGITLSNLREAGAPIKGYAGAASGVVPVMKLFEDSFSYSNQLGQRQGAGVVYLNVFHPDIIAFLSTKKENADEKVRVKTLSLGITVPDKFYELARKNEDMYLFSPYNVEKEYGIPFNYLDITNMYDELVANPKITKTKIKARDLETEISKLQQESGYPYIINIDTANKANPIDGKIIMSNLCSEILQVQTPSLINDAQEFVEMGTDISCNLGSTNILNMMTSPDFGRSIKTMTRALTFVTDSSSIEA
ncbi:TPA: ribonucleotide-diphosphate reductase subunit alpha, partial [Streptococcus pyogenes]|nr:ribonucleotide-diphosphate reductase subunit alpha [Streptococcus pyogenes]